MLGLFLGLCPKSAVVGFVVETQMKSFVLLLMPGKENLWMSKVIKSYVILCVV